MVQPRLYNLTDLHSILGVSRNRLSVTIDNFPEIQTFRGRKNSKCINEDGLKKLKKILGTMKPEYFATRKPRTQKAAS